MECSQLNWLRFNLIRVGNQRKMYLLLRLTNSRLNNPDMLFKIWGKEIEWIFRKLKIEINLSHQLDSIKYQHGISWISQNRWRIQNGIKVVFDFISRRINILNK